MLRKLLLVFRTGLSNSLEVSPFVKDMSDDWLPAIGKDSL